MEGNAFMKPQITKNIGVIFFFTVMTAFFYIFVKTPVLAATGINQVINFQGKLINKSDNTNISDNTYAFTFKLYDAGASGNQLPNGSPWSETQVLQVTNGIFTAGIGSSTAFPSTLNFNSDSLYLDITFNGETFGSRVRLTASPYAFNAQTVNGLTFSNNSGNVGIGNTTPVSLLDVSGTAWIRGTTGVPYQGLYVNSAGYVGVGKTNPSFALDVTGTIQASTILTAPTLTVTNINGTGNVGVGGTISTVFALNVVGSENISVGLSAVTLTQNGNRVCDSSGGANCPATSLTGGATNYLARWNSSTALTTGVSYDNGSSVGIGYTNPNSNTLLAVNGNVGIGTTITAAKLDVWGTSWLHGTAGTYAGLFVDANGNVGIGKTNPGFALDVVGTAFASTVLSAPTVTATNIIAINGMTAPQFSNSSGYVQFGQSGVGTTIAGSQLYFAQNTWTATPTISGLITANGGITASTGVIAPMFGASSGSSLFGSAGIGTTITSSAGGISHATLAIFNSNVSDLGNMGVGTTTPAATYSLYVAGQIYGTTIVQNGNKVCDSSGLNCPAATLSGGALNYLARWNGTTTLTTGVSYDNGTNLGVGNTAPVGTLDVSGTAWIRGTTGVPYQGLYVTSAGNVGIGLTNPTAKLYVVGEAKAEILSTDGGNPSGSTVMYIQPNASQTADVVDIKNLAGTGNFFTINNNGNVGIGTTSPSASYELYVVGNAYATTFTQNGNNVVDTTGGFSNYLARFSGSKTLTTGISYDNGTSVGIGYTNPGSGAALAVNGNVSIGATSNTSRLGIRGAGTTTGFTFHTEDSNGVDKFVILDNGTVGIGTTSPIGQLDVLGTMTGYTGLTDYGMRLIPTLSGTISSATPMSAFYNMYNVPTINLSGTAPQISKVYLDYEGATVGAGTTISSFYSKYIASPTINAGVITNNYALVTEQNAGKVAIGYTAAVSGALLVNGNTGIGWTNPKYLLSVMGNTTNAAVVSFVNLATGNTNNSVLRLGVGTTATASTTNTRFIQFFSNATNDQSGTGLGNIRMNKTTAVTYASNGADFAEYFPTTVTDFKQGDVVALGSDGRAIKATDGKHIIGIVSDSAAFVGNDKGDQSGYVLVGLLGQLPVSIDPSSPSIGPGDYLTASLMHGMATKALKAGYVLGQAQESWDNSSDKTKINIVLSVNWYTPGLDGVITQGSAILSGHSQTFVYNPTQGEEILASLINNQSQVDVSHPVDMSVDRVAAGLEVITPKVTTQEILTHIITSSHDNDLTVQIDQGKNIIFRSKDASGSAIVFDSYGNATFSGTLVADKIKANHIEGLDILTNDLTSLNLNVASLEARVNEATQSGQVAGAETASIAPPDIANLFKNGLNIEGSATIAADLQVNGSTLISGVLNVIDTLTSTNAIFGKLADFMGSVIFHGDVSFLGRPTFNTDTAGTIVIAKGSDHADVNFTKEYANTPVVSTSMSFNDLPIPDGASKIDDTHYKMPDGTVRSLDDDRRNMENQILSAGYFYIISRKTTKGFSIRLNKSASSDLAFSWIALATNGSNTASNNQSPFPQNPIPTATPVATISAQLP